MKQRDLDLREVSAQLERREPHYGYHEESRPPPESDGLWACAKREGVNAIWSTDPPTYASKPASRARRRRLPWQQRAGKGYRQPAPNRTNFLVFVELDHRSSVVIADLLERLGLQTALTSWRDLRSSEETPAGRPVVAADGIRGPYPIGSAGPLHDGDCLGRAPPRAEISSGALVAASPTRRQGRAARPPQRAINTPELKPIPCHGRRRG